MKFNILIVEDDAYSLENISLGLDNQDYNLFKAQNYSDALAIAKSNEIHLLITDYKMPGKNGLELAQEVKKKNLVKNIILITGFGDEEVLERAIKIGLKDFIRKPYKEIELINSVEKIYKQFVLEVENQKLKKLLEAENKILKEKLLSNDTSDFVIIGQSTELKIQLRKALKAAQYSLNCLIQGETGTGKEVVARYIHKNGARSNKPFIAVNCASLTPSLFESELFGFVKGAFTNALEARPGLFELANGGVIFLDEITEIPKEFQAKLLRVI